MLFKKLLLLLLMLLTVWAGYLLYLFFKKKIDAYRSFAHFLLLVLACLASLFLLVFLFSWLIIYFRGFFFQ